MAWSTTNVQATVVTLICVISSCLAQTEVTVCGEAFDLGSTVIARGAVGCTSIPTEIGLLSELVFLDFRGNEIGSLPTEIGNLTSLVHFNIPANRLSTLPAEIARLTRLTLLNLQVNSFTTFPIEVTTVTSLERLFLGNNLISEVPSEIGGLTDLNDLELGSNPLGGFPTELFLLPQLEKLFLSDIQAATLPTEVGLLTKVTTLAVGSNPFGEFPTEIYLLPQLEKLFLSEVEVGALPTDIAFLSQLSNLALDNCKLVELPTEIGNITQLRTLLVEGNELSALPTEIGHLSQLTKLFTQNNRDGMIIPTELMAITGLQAVNLGSVRCDCTLLSSYSAFATEIFTSGEFAVASCSDESAFNGIDPVQLALHPTAPCSELERLSNTTGLRRSLVIAWKDPEIERVDIALANVGPDVDNGENIDFRDAVSGLVLSTEEASERLRSCQDTFRMFSPDKLFGYKITLSQNAVTVRERCGFATDFGYTNESTSETVLSVTIGDLVPASTYEVTIAPFLLENTDVFYNEGPESAPIFITTAEDKPEGNISIVQSRLREADRVIIEWDDPSFPNGVIAEYEIHLLNGSRVETSQVASINLENLEPDTVYGIQVRAATSAGFGDLSQTYFVKTCPANMKALSDEGDCFADRGFFLSKDGEPLACIDFLDKIELQECVGENVLVQNLSVIPGFWRTSEESAEILSCPLPAGCIGGKGNLCASAYGGPLCGVCAMGFFDTGIECLACSTGTGIQDYVLIFGILIVLVATCFAPLRRYYRSLETYTDLDSGIDRYCCSPESHIATVTGLIIDRLGEFGELLAPVISFYQLVVSYVLVLRIHVSTSALAFILGFGQVFTFDLTSLVKADCFLFENNNYALPLVGYLGVTLIWTGGYIYYSLKDPTRRDDPEPFEGSNCCWTRGCWQNEFWERHPGLKWLFGIVTGSYRYLAQSWIAFFYVFLTSLIARTFACAEFDDNSSFMEADLKVDCSSELYQGIRVAALLGYVLFLLPVLAVYLRRWRHFSKDDNDDSVHRSKESMYTFWYLFHKFTIVGLLHLIPSPGLRLFALLHVELVFLWYLIGDWHSRDFVNRTKHINELLQRRVTILEMVAACCRVSICAALLLLVLAEDRLTQDTSNVLTIMCLWTPLVAYVVSAVVSVLGTCCRSENSGSSTVNNKVPAKTDSSGVTGVTSRKPTL